MYRRPSRKKELLQRTIVYTLMTTFVVLLVSFLVFIILGYRFDITNGRVERDALIQFDSYPRNAKIQIDGELVNDTTQAKQFVVEGQHMFTVMRDGFQPWEKTLVTRADTITWLDYIRLVPIAPETESVADFAKLHRVYASDDAGRVVVQQDGGKPDMSVYILGSSRPTVRTLSVPASILSKIDDSKLTHAYELRSIDEQGRYGLMVHTYGSSKEWILVNFENIASSLNITTDLDVNISDAQLAGTSGSIVYGLIEGKVRKLDLANETISRTLVDNVSSFQVVSTSLLTYEGTAESGAKKIVGVYRDGDNRSVILRSLDKNKSSVLKIAVGRYLNDDYVLIGEDAKADLYVGTLPSPDMAMNDSLSLLESFVLSGPTKQLSFGPQGAHAYVATASAVQSYDVEYKTVSVFDVEGSYHWLDEHHLWLVSDDTFYMLDFDGTNKQQIVAADAKSIGIISSNDRFIYSVAKTDTGYNLQRTILLP